MQLLTGAWCWSCCRMLSATVKTLWWTTKTTSLLVATQAQVWRAKSNISLECTRHCSPVKSERSLGKHLFKQRTHPTCRFNISWVYVNYVIWNQNPLKARHASLVCTKFAANLSKRVLNKPQGCQEGFINTALYQTQAKWCNNGYNPLNLERVLDQVESRNVMLLSGPGTAWAMRSDHHLTHPLGLTRQQCE